MTTWNDAFEKELTQEDEDYESGSENVHIPTHSAEPPESTVSPQWMCYPTIWQILVNHLQLQSSMQSHHLTATATTASHATTWYSPALMMRVP